MSRIPVCSCTGRLAVGTQPPFHVVSRTNRCCRARIASVARLPRNRSSTMQSRVQSKITSLGSNAFRRSDSDVDSVDFVFARSTAVEVIVADFAQRLLHPPLAALGEDGLEVAFEEGAGVLEVLFGVGFGGGDARQTLRRGCRRSAAVRGAGEVELRSLRVMLACELPLDRSCQSPFSWMRSVSNQLRQK